MRLTLRYVYVLAIENQNSIGVAIRIHPNNASPTLARGRELAWMSPPQWPDRGKKGCSCPRRRRPLSLGEPTVAQPPGEGPSAVNVCWSRCRQNALTLVGGRSRPEARFAQVQQGVTITACSRRFGQKTRSRLPRFRGDALATS